jgi:hypothetical protein
MVPAAFADSSAGARDTIPEVMALTKDELVSSLQNEVRILLHLASKIDPAKQDYRPAAKQRSTLELMQYMVIMGPQLVRGIKGGAFDPASWTAAEAGAKAMNLEQAKVAIGEQSAFFGTELGGWSEADFATKIEMFGQTSSRGSLIANMVLCGYAAYRTQLFLYLKASGREELNTMNLWAGMDGSM